MILTNQPLLNLTANELMSPASVVVPAAMSLQGAARILGRANVTGAPVVDARGCCVGVISATDFLHWAENAGRKGGGEAVCSAWQILESDDLPEESVRDHMTADPVTAAAVTPIGELARMMLDAHIHRVIVVDAERRPVGVVSATDLLAAIAQADAARRAASKPEAQPAARRAAETCNR